MDFEQELARRAAKAKARRNSVKTTTAPTITPTTTTTTTLPSTPLISTNTPLLSPNTTPTTTSPKELSYEDILAGRDFGSPDIRGSNVGYHCSVDDNDNGSPTSSSSSKTSNEDPPSTAPTVHEDEDDTWDTGISPTRTTTKYVTKEDDFFRVGDHPSLTEAIDFPSEILPLPRRSDDEDRDAEDDDDDEDEDEQEERREELMQHERTRRASTSVQYDAPQQLAVEYIIRREEAHVWLKKMLVPAGLTQLSDSLLPLPSKLSAGLCNGVILCEVIRCLRGLRPDEMTIHRTFPPAIARMRASDNIRQFLGKYYLLK